METLNDDISKLIKEYNDISYYIIVITRNIIPDLNRCNLVKGFTFEGTNNGGRIYRVFADNSEVPIRDLINNIINNAINIINLLVVKYDTFVTITEDYSQHYNSAPVFVERHVEGIYYEY